MEIDHKKKLQYQTIWNYFSGAGKWVDYAKEIRSEEGLRLRQNLELFWEKKQSEGVTELGKEMFLEWVEGVEKMSKMIKKNSLQVKGKKGHRVTLSMGGGGYILGQNEKGQYTIRDKTGKITQGVPEQLITEFSLESAKASEFLRVGDVIVCKQGLGIIRYIGTLVGAQPDPKEEFIGIEIKDSSKALPRGKNDGCFMGKRYFRAQKSQGLFITLDDIKKFLTPEDLLKTLAQLNTLRIVKREEYKMCLDRRSNIKMVVSSTRSLESCTINAPIEELYALLRPFSFKYAHQIRSVVNTGQKGVGSLRRLTYRDGTVQTIQIRGIDDLYFELSWILVTSVPAVTYSSVVHQIRLYRISTQLKGQHAKTYMKWQSDFSNDATANVIADSNLKKRDAFKQLKAATKKVIK